MQEIHELKEELTENKAKIKRMKIENSLLKQAVDIFEKWLRWNNAEEKKNIRIHGVPEIIGNRDDGEKAALEIAEKLNIDTRQRDTRHAITRLK